MIITNKEKNKLNLINFIFNENIIKLNLNNNNNNQNFNYNFNLKKLFISEINGIYLSKPKWPIIISLTIPAIVSLIGFALIKRGFSKRT